jgi:hypothetical protein
MRSNLAEVPEDFLLKNKNKRVNNFLKNFLPLFLNI